mmetsp:Transcript_33519/g.51378  ORF Transcript_33519/g.51378 Transcript_33519/m.51378 type:complete len:149 (+) Transcript_33519:86-532(+)
MKFSYLITLLTVGMAAAFAPNAASSPKTTTALNAEMDSRRAFLGGAAAAAAAAVAFVATPPPAANAMQQEYVADPTEQWETGSPTAKAEEARIARFKNARTQMTSNFAPIKRLTLERKSPVTRLDLNSPGFQGYKDTYPGLFKDAPKK